MYKYMANSQETDRQSGDVWQKTGWLVHPLELKPNEEGEGRKVGEEDSEKQERGGREGGAEMEEEETGLSLSIRHGKLIREGGSCSLQVHRIRTWHSAGN